METKFKAGDKIRITKTSFEAKKRYQVGDIKTIIGENRQGFIVDSNWQYECPAYISNHETVNPCYKCEWELVEEKPLFHDAQIGDLLWNDEVGICRVEQVDKDKSIYPIKIISEYCTDQITLDGKKHHYSPKATFFYYSPENHYLTERPENDEVDWSKIPMNTQVFASDGELVNPQNAVSFFGYFPELERPFWIFIGMTEDNAEGFKNCKLAEPCKPEWRK